MPVTVMAVPGSEEATQVEATPAAGVTPVEATPVEGIPAAGEDPTEAEGMAVGIRKRTRSSSS